VTEEVENLILQHLRAIRETLGQHGEHLERIDARLIALEQRATSTTVELGAINVRMAQVESRLDRIEKRLGLIEA
jgi:ubiquinone biosynthesis protein UbiJ